MGREAAVLAGRGSGQGPPPETSGTHRQRTRGSQGDGEAGARHEGLETAQLRQRQWVTVL